MLFDPASLSMVAIAFGYLATVGQVSGSLRTITPVRAVTALPVVKSVVAEKTC